jgi:hypothetical protein
LCYHLSFTSTCCVPSRKTNQRFAVKYGSFVARLPKVEIPELDYKLKDGSDDLFNNRRLKNLVVENVSVSTKYIARLLPTSGHEWILINSFTFFRLQGKQRISEVAPSPGGFSTARLLGWNKGEKIQAFGLLASVLVYVFLVVLEVCSFCTVVSMNLVRTFKKNSTL